MIAEPRRYKLAEMVKAGQYDRTEAYFSKDFSIIQKFRSDALAPWVKLGFPYVCSDWRLILFRSGSIKLQIGLKVCKTKGPSPFVAIAPPGTTILPLEVYADSEVSMVGFSGLSALEQYVPLPGFCVYTPPKIKFERLELTCAYLNALAHRDPSFSVLEDGFRLLADDVLNSVSLGARNVHGHIRNLFFSLLMSRGAISHPVSYYAKLLKVTPAVLNAAVKSVEPKETPLSLINRALILQAKVLLLHSDSTAEGIAKALGLSGGPYFCRFFKRETGMTPTEYCEHARAGVA